MKETLGSHGQFREGWPLDRPPRPPLAMAAGRGRLGEKHGKNQGRKSCLLMEKPVLAIFEGV